MNKGLYERYFKRVFDLMFAIILLILSIPFIFLGSIFIKLDSFGPVFFKQTRIGYKCEKFKIYKLRTMRLETHDEEGRKLKDSERITKAGRLIRMLSIDELPQLLNILKGEMSFIGPRPLLVRYLPYYTKKEIRRHDVLPGITGLAQINGRSNIQWEERFDYDLEYVNNMSLILDIKILLKTVQKVFKGSDTSIIRPKNLVDFDEHRNFKKMR